MHAPEPNAPKKEKGIGRRKFVQHAGQFGALTVLAIGASALGTKRFRAWLEEPCVDVSGPCGMCPQVGGCELPKVVAHRQTTQTEKSPNSD